MTSAELAKKKKLVNNICFPFTLIVCLFNVQNIFMRFPLSSTLLYMSTLRCEINTYVQGFSNLLQFQYFYAHFGSDQ